MNKDNQKKPNTNTKSGMVDLIEIFKERDTVFKGLIKEELLALYNKIPLEKVVALNWGKKRNMWKNMKKVSKYLVDAQQLAIIFKPMPSGTELTDVKFGKRTLSKERNIFFRCIEIEDAWDYRNRLDKMSNGINTSANNTVAIVESEKKNEGKKKEVIKVLAR